MKTLDFVEQETMRSDLPPFRVGDAVRVHVRVREGEKERIQVFEGLVIRRRGSGAGETFTVRKISSGVGVERIFPVQSPLVTKVEIKSRGYVRRSRLYYLRNLTGKKARLHSKVRDLSELVSPEEMAARDEEPEVAETTEEAVVVETQEKTKGLKGKARKKAKAAEKAVRQKQLAEEEARRKAAEPTEPEAEADESAEAAEAEAVDENSES